MNRNWKRALCALLVCLGLAPGLSLTAFAHEVPDPTKRGSVTVTMEYGGAPVAGGTLTAYRVGDLREEDGNYDFVLSNKFEGSGADLTDISSAALAQKLADHANARNLRGTGVTIGNDGKAKFTDLELGLYLIVQTEASPGYDLISPFLVSVPYHQDGHYLYEIDATSKLGLLQESEPTKSDPTGLNPPTNPDPTDPVPPTAPNPTGSTLPQTGQLNWPVPLMAVLGMTLLLVGFGLRYGKKETPHAP